MRSKGLLSARGLVCALVLAIAGLALAWLCVITALVGVLPPDAPAVMRVAPTNANATLARASTALAKSHALLGGAARGLDAATLNEVRHAASIAPLDARYFLILGHQQLVQGKSADAVKSLEAGQRLNPRNRFIHLLLLERYLLANRFTDAAKQFSVLARLVGAAQPTIAAAMAQMLIQPDMRDAARRTLRTDPMLEQAVLVTLAKGSSEPDDIFSLASPKALNNAGDEESWGPALVSRLVSTDRFQMARAAWQRIYKLPADATYTPIFNPSFKPTPASAPFNWTLTAGGLGAADPRHGALDVDYYGRDTGNLASQLLVLAPGRYEIAFAAEGGKPDTASHLFWTIACAGNDKTVLANVAVPTMSGARRAGSPFVVPAKCVAQSLTLRGEAGEFPSPVTLTIKDLVIHASTETKL